MNGWSALTAASFINLQRRYSCTTHQSVLHLLLLDGHHVYTSRRLCVCLGVCVLDVHVFQVNLFFFFLRLLVLVCFGRIPDPVPTTRRPPVSDLPPPPTHIIPPNPPCLHTGDPGASVHVWVWVFVLSPALMTSANCIYPHNLFSLQSVAPHGKQSGKPVAGPDKPDHVPGTHWGGIKTRSLFVDSPAFVSIVDHCCISDKMHSECNVSFKCCPLCPCLSSN